MIIKSSASFWSALESGNAEQVARFLREQPELAQSRHDQDVSAIRFVLYSGQGHLIPALLSAGVRGDVHDASALGDIDRLRQCLDGIAADVDLYSGDGWTPLHMAAFFAQAKACRWLLQRGADVHAVSQNPMENTALHAAIAGSTDLATIEQLLNGGADAMAVSAGGFRPLHLAAARGDAAVIAMLRSAGATPVGTDDGTTPADLARQRGHAELADQLE